MVFGSMAEAGRHMRALRNTGQSDNVVLPYEIHTIDRSPSVGDFLSYASLVTPQQTSDGKVTGHGGRTAAGARTYLISMRDDEMSPFRTVSCVDEFLGISLRHGLQETRSGRFVHQ
jgi:hypothetical protein